ncbi:DUF998 domain-containing protein [Stenotrophomonas sp. 3(2025)]|uniref:DUF998 domain-containing protein n=1 Tax=Stenotrophomonas sp. 3(2025) TaxID=3456023 RepID=UPI004043C089
MLRRSRILLSAGLVPLPWFLFWTSVATVFATGYNPLAQHASELLQVPTLASVSARIAAIGSGVGFVAFSIGVWRESGRRIAVGAICWMVFGVSMLTNGLWPMGHPMHGFYTIGIANIIAPAMSHIELTAWSANRRAYAVTAVVSIAGIFYLWLNLLGADPEGFRGLTQRLFSSINSLWPFLVALYLLRRDSSALQTQPAH